jgi:MFS transporter, DHA3 family, macrolide efflux protein
LGAFGVVWLGQMVSVLATQMTQFALTIWVYQKTGSATALGLMLAFYYTPFVVAALFAGPLVDRYDRKVMMMVSDLGAGVATVILFSLQATGALQIWHLYGAGIITGVAQAFQWPAYSAAISTLVPKEHYGRANGLMSLIETGPGVLAPLLAGALLPFIQLSGIMLIDIATFLAAIGSLLLIEVPSPLKDTAPAKQPSFWNETAFGFRYIWQRPSLLGLQLIVLLGNLFITIGYTVIAPMILTRTGNNASLYGLVQSAGALGGLVGGITMSVWGGFKRRTNGILLGWLGLSLFGVIFMGLGRDLWIWIPAIFIWIGFSPIIDGSSQAIWQAKVAPALQGRVFSARQIIALVTTPIAPLIGGLLADRVFEPGMRNGTLTPLFGWLVGTGPGTGMAVIIIGAGVLTALVPIGAYFVPAIRNAETILPDHDAAEGST